MSNIDREYLFKSFLSAMNDVVGTMAGFAMKEYRDDLDERQSHSGEITGAMLVLGEKNAMVTITMEKETASVLVAYMTGIDPAELEDEEVFDGVAELVNLVTGRAKAIMAGTEYYFNITPPFTIVGSDHYIMHKSRASKVAMKYVAGELEFFLELFYI
ncbi:MAG: chemotaxis protein CheX [Candidatus Saccharibacteria bacterium]